MFGGGVDPWIYHEVGGLRPPIAAEAPRLTLGVECEVMQRVRSASAETMMHGHKARSSWSWDGRTLEYGATVPVGFRATLVLPSRCADGALATLAEGVNALVWSADESEEVAAVVGVAGVGLQWNGESSLQLEILSGVFGFRAVFEG